MMECYTTAVYTDSVFDRQTLDDKDSAFFEKGR